MRGIVVNVVRSNIKGTDSHGNPISRDDVEVVENVLVHRPTTQDIIDNQTIETGYDLTFSCVFPKTYEKSLRGCRIVIPKVDPKREFYVVGDPKPIPHGCPTKWNRKVLVGVSNG